MQTRSRDIDAKLLGLAIRCFESGEALDEPRRKARERQSCRFFFKACGLNPPKR